MRSSSALVAVALVASLAHAEGVDSRQKIPDTAARLHGVTTMKPMAGGGLVTLGGSSLRVLAPRARTFETLHRQPGDNLYRVAVNGSGGVLAAWEKDTSLHYFTPAPRRHLTLPKPAAPSTDLSYFNVDHLELLPNGRDALVHMYGRGYSRRRVDTMFRVALDGRSPPELLYQVDGGFKLHITRNMAVYLIPRNPNQECDNRTCHPVAAVVAYEFTDSGVSQKTLLSSEQVEMSNARLVWGSDEDRVVLQLDLKGNERALLRWSRGDAQPQYRTLAKGSYWSEELYATKAGEVLQLEMKPEEALVIRRYLTDGGEQVLKIPAPSDPNTIDTNIHDVGERSNGTLWMHWGDYLLLFSADMARPPRAYNLEPLLTRRAEWAGVGIYVQTPELLWVGIEVGRGRDFVRMSFADMEKRAKPWPSK